MKVNLSDALKKLKEIKGVTLVVIGIAAGLLCLVMSGGTDKTESEDKIEAETTKVTLAEYTEAEEDRVSSLLNAINGVRSSRVMLTFESGSEYIYDTGGYSRSEPLLLEEHPPKVCGAAVVCVGGDDPEVQMKIMNLLCSLYGISSARVSIAGST